MNYVYHGLYMREPSGIEGKDRCWVFIRPNDCGLVVKVPSEYTEDDIRALVESMPDPENPDPEPDPEPVPEEG